MKLQEILEAMKMERTLQGISQMSLSPDNRPLTSPPIADGTLGRASGVARLRRMLQRKIDLKLMEIYVKKIEELIAGAGDTHNKELILKGMKEEVSELVQATFKAAVEEQSSQNLLALYEASEAFLAISELYRRQSIHEQYPNPAAIFTPHDPTNDESLVNQSHGQKCNA